MTEGFAATVASREEPKPMIRVVFDTNIMGLSGFPNDICLMQ